MNYYSIEPEVPGGWGANTRADTSIHPPVVSHFHFEFSDWLGDELIETFPCYLVTDALARQLEGLSGFRIAPVEISFSQEFQDWHPNGLTERPMPEWHWLQITGMPWEDDFFIGEGYSLVVSKRALEVLRPYVQRAEVNEVDSNSAP